MKIIFERHLIKRNYPKNLVNEDIVHFEHEFEKIIRECHVINATNVFIINDVLFNSLNIRKWISYSQLFPVTNFFLIKRLLFLRKGWETIEEGVWIIDNWSHGYFHWLTDALPRLIASNWENENLPILLPENYKGINFVKESLKLLGRKIIFFKCSKGLRVKRLLLPSHTALTGNYNVILINELRKIYLSKFNKKGERKIYISREKALKRKIVNENDVIVLLKQNDWEVHYFENYTFEKQIEIMSQCKYLIGLHGAGLTNMLFMREGGKILELSNHTDARNNCYFSLASALNHDYYYHHNIGTMNYTGNADIIVNIKVLKKIIENFNE